MILRFLALTFYVMMARNTLMYLFRGMTLRDTSEWFLLAGQIIMILGLILDRKLIMSAALIALSTGYWLKAVTAVRSMVIWDINILEVILFSFFVLSAALCACILYTEIVQPEHNGKTFLKLIGCHVLVLVLYVRYQEIIYALFVGVLPSIVTTPYNIRMTGKLQSVILALAGTLTNGFLVLTHRD